MSNTQNVFKYTGLTYADLMAQLTSAIVADPRFSAFNATALAEMLLEMFAGTTDINNYYIQRTAEERFFSTMQKLSSAILESRNMGYVITRPIPASTTLQLTLQGDFSWLQVGYKLQIPIYQKLSYNNFDFLFLNTFTYTFTGSDI